MRKLKPFLKSVCFLLLLSLVVLGVQRLFKVKDYRIYQTERGFYSERDNSLDAVYIGPSHVYTFFQAPLAWDSQGIAVYPLSVPSMPHHALIYMIEEARKTQPDALIILNVNVFKVTAVTESKIHFLSDYMPLSLNKIRMVNALCDAAGFGLMDRMEYFFPIIRFHSGWDSLDAQDFTYHYNGMKGGCIYKTFLSTSKDITSKFTYLEESGEVEEELVEELLNVLDYCDSEGINVLFVTVPQGRSSKPEALKRWNSIEDYIRERGYDCLDLMGATDEIGLQLDTDYYNASHANVHGSLKYTDYLCRYLVENYGFTDKRGTPGYESWDEAAELYNATISQYTLPLEREHAPRDYSLEAPVPAVYASGRDVTVSWEKVEGADGYAICRKSDLADDQDWKELEVVRGVTAYTDTDLANGVYVYTVVPVRSEDGSLCYGDFSISGAQVTIAETVTETVVETPDPEEEEEEGLG